MTDPWLTLSARARYVLNGIGIALALVIVRLWHLTVISHEAKLEEARRPQQKVIVEPAKRGTIRDRYNLPLAINRVQYQATVIYSQLQQIPSCVWKQGADGKRVRSYRRREYISQLAEVLATELNLDPQRVEDLIHSKAALYQQVPFVLKEELTEREYYRLKMLERHWLGLAARRQPRRHYPQGKIGADVIGYLGAIDRAQYEAILQQVKTLSHFLQQWEAGEEPPLPLGMATIEEVESRLADLRERAYGINDMVGKTGIERQHEELLRGFQGKRSYFSDARGNFLRELPGGHPPQAGMRLLLTLSAELQAFAEQLLIASDGVREARISVPGSLENSIVAPKQPWIRGGGIVALDPHSGDVLALASYPRIDPNDFIGGGSAADREGRKKRVARWLESEGHLADLWDQREPLLREVVSREGKEVEEERRWLTWEEYLAAVLPREGPLHQAISGLATLADAVAVQQAVEELLELAESQLADGEYGDLGLYPLLNALYPDDLPHGNAWPLAVARDYSQKAADSSAARSLTVLDKYLKALPTNYDKALIIDLCRLAVDARYFDDPEVLAYCSSCTLSEHRRHCCAATALRELLRRCCRELFYQADFAMWRDEHSKEFLQEERAKEKAEGRYAQPYLDLFDKRERELFAQFWDEHGEELLAVFLLGKWGAIDATADGGIASYFGEMARWHRLLIEVGDSGDSVEATGFTATEIAAFRELARKLETMPPWLAADYLISLRSYRQLTRPLFGHYRHLRCDADGIQREKHLATAFYPLYGYSYGRSYAYRQATTQGSIFKLITAYAALAKQGELQEQGLVAKDDFNPLAMVDTVERHGKQLLVGYAADGSPIPQHYRGGRLPKSLKRRIGTLDIVKAIVTSSNPYFSLLAGDFLTAPAQLLDAARLFSYGSPTGIALPGEIGGKLPTDLDSNRTGLYATAIGQHTLIVTPLQAAVMLASLANGGRVLRPKIVSVTAGRSKTADSDAQSLVIPCPTQVQREIWLPQPVRYILLDSMRQVAVQAREVSLRALKHLYKKFPSLVKSYVSLGEQLVGKTSTAESVEVLELGYAAHSHIYNHLWFGGILFGEEGNGEGEKSEKEGKSAETYLFRDQYGHPELVVVVYLRYGGYGKDAAPIAARVAERWRAIKKGH